MDEKKPAVSPEKKGNPKKTILYLSSVVLVAVVSVLVTLAYLGTNSNKEVNTFLGSEGIQLELDEKAWTTKSPVDTTKPNGTMKPSEEERAKDYTPGQTYNKDPKLINTSTNAKYEEWVAMKVHFDIGYKDKTGKLVTGAAANEKKITSNWKTFWEIAEIVSDEGNTTITAQTKEDGTITKKVTKDGFNTGSTGNKWTLIATGYTEINSTTNKQQDVIVQTYSMDTAQGKENTIKSKPDLISDGDNWAIFVYNSKLNTIPEKDEGGNTNSNSNKTTSNLFNQIKMKEQSVFEDKGWISNADGKSEYNLPSFNINVIGAAIKVEDTNDTSSGNLFTNCKDKKNVLDELCNLLKDK